MPAAVIPVTGLIQGPIGSISQSDTPLTTNRLVNPADTLSIAFGEPLVLNSNNTYSSVKTYITTDSSSVTGSTPIAFAQANVKTNTVYPNNSSASIANSGVYLPGQPCDALVRGTITVAVPYGTPAGAGAQCYIRTSTSGSYPNSAIGQIEGSSLTGNTLLTNGIVFTTGVLSTDPQTGQISAQVTILVRLIP